jgi:hypothetical protein
MTAADLPSAISVFRLKGSALFFIMLVALVGDDYRENPSLGPTKHRGKMAPRQ